MNDVLSSYFFTAKTILLGSKHPDNVSFEFENKITGYEPTFVKRWLLVLQEEGVQFLLKAYRSGRGAILADDMGLGKTVQTITFLAAALDYEKLMNARQDGRIGRSPLAVVIVPSSLIDNWAREFKVWTPGLVVRVTS